MIQSDNAGGKGVGAARFVMGACWLVFGLTKLLAVGGTIGFIGHKGLPFPQAVFWLAILIECGLGAALMLGIKTREVALLLAAYCLFIAFVFHLDLGDRVQRDNFLKTIFMSAGLVAMAFAGPGAFALGAGRRP